MSKSTRSLGASTRRNPVVSLLVLITLQALALSAPAGALPLVAGNFSIAQQFLHGNAHVILIGDSEQNGLVGYYPSHLQVDHWSGITSSPNLTDTFSGHSGASSFSYFQNPFTTDYPAPTYVPDNSPPALAGASPGAFTSIQFNGTTAPDDGGNILQNRIYELSLAANQQTTFAGGAWADKSTGQLHAQVIYYANPNGVANGLQFLTRTDTGVVASMPLSTYDTTSHIASKTLTFNAQSWPSGGLAGDFRVLPGATPPAGSNATILGVRYYTDDNGFQFSSIAEGGMGIDHFLTSATDANLGAFINLTDTNIAMIWIGQNDPGKYSPAAWKVQMQALIARYKAARPDMKFVLISTYDTQPLSGPQTLAGYSQDLYDISQSDPSVLFLNLYDSAGSFDFLNANYLSDGVHPSVAGLPYFADQVNSLLQSAAAQVPEPTSLALVACASAALLSRRRRSH